MKRVVVRYKVKPERIEEHEALIRAVFDELAEKAPSGIRYGAFKEPDGLSFVHLAFVDASENPLQALDAFRAFTASIRDRCDIPPEAVDIADIGAYGL